MAKVQGVKEKLHSPVYDAFFVKADQTKTFKDFMTDPRVIRFFVDVQNKTKLETNLQAAGVLPSLNTFEARAMRVVASSTFCVSREALNAPTVRKEIVAAADVYHGSSGDTAAQDTLVNTIRDKIEVVTGVAAVINKQIRADIVNVAEEYKAITTPSQLNKDRLVNAVLDAFEAGCAAASTVLPELIFNSVTTLIVGEKIMIETPTFYFPSGAGVSPGNGTVNNHGEPDPMATFRFSEPVIIEPQQNFRVEMLFPQGVPGQSGVPGNLANVSGPLRIWVVLDGYLTRDVQ